MYSLYAGMNRSTKSATSLSLKPAPDRSLSACDDDDVYLDELQRKVL
jgi:hypothetical protein